MCTHTHAYIPSLLIDFRSTRIPIISTQPHLLYAKTQHPRLKPCICNFMNTLIVGK